MVSRGSTSSGFKDLERRVRPAASAFSVCRAGGRSDPGPPTGIEGGSGEHQPGGDDPHKATKTPENMAHTSSISDPATSTQSPIEPLNHGLNPGNSGDCHHMLLCRHSHRRAWLKVHPAGMSTKSIIPVTLVALALSLAAADLSDEIGRNVAKLLAAHREYRNVTFSVEDEIVTVSGKVPTWTNRTDLEWSLRRIQHVRSVRNDVILDPPAVSDEVLRARVKKALTAAGFADVRFQAHEGLVILTGSVRTRLQWARVRDLAWSVEGVREVITRVNVAEE